nr:ELM2 domain-containing protein [Tanacetum cinerariifolium]
MDILAKHAARKAAKLELQSSFKSSPVAGDAATKHPSTKHASPLANPKPKAPKLKPSDVTESDQGDGSGSEEGDGSGSEEEEGDKEDDEEKVDEDEDEEDAIVKDEEYEEEKEKVSEEEEEEEEDEDVNVKRNKRGRKGKGEVVMSKEKKIKFEDKEFAPKKKKRIFATDIAEKLVGSTRVDFMFKVNFLMLFANVMGKADTMRAFVNLSVVRCIREDTNIAGLDWCDFIHSCLAISHEPNTISGFYNGPLCFLIYLEIEDEAFGKLDIYGEWSENETVEAEGVVHVTAEKVHEILGLAIEKLSRISKEKAEVETLLRDVNKEFSNDDNVKQLFKQYKGFFKETVLLEEAKARETPQNVKPKPAAMKTKEAAEKPKLTENVKELAEKPKEPAEKAQEAPQNVKPKPAAMKTKEAAEKPKLTENVKELAKKPKEPAEKAQEVPQNVKPKPAAVKTKEAAEKPKSAENVKEVAKKPKEPAEKAQEAPQYELAKKPKEPAGDDYLVVVAATVMKAEDREEFEVETFTHWVEGNIDWVGELHDWPRVVEPINMVQPSTPKRVFSSPSKGYVKPDKTVNTPYMCRRIDVTARCKRIEFVLGNSLFAMDEDK